jgi:hypothetical protein
MMLNVNVLEIWKSWSEGFKLLLKFFEGAAGNPRNDGCVGHVPLPLIGPSRTDRRGVEVRRVGPVRLARRFATH